MRTVEEQEYHKLVLLVGDFFSGKTRLMRQVCDEIGGVYLNVNLELTRRLLTIDARTYATRASRILQDLCDELEPDRPLFLDNVELLFSPEVGCLNPVDLFKKVSRERLVVRPEIRWDWASDCAVHPCVDATRDYQLLVAVDAIVTF